MSDAFDNRKRLTGTLFSYGITVTKKRLSDALGADLETVVASAPIEFQNEARSILSTVASTLPTSNPLPSTVPVNVPSYSKLSSDEIREVMVYFYIFGKKNVAATVRYMKTRIRGNKIPTSESSVRRWAKAIKPILQKESTKHADYAVACQSAVDIFLNQQPINGRPKKLPQLQYENLLKLINSVRAASGRISPLIVVSLAKAVVQNSGDGSKLFENGEKMRHPEFAGGTRWARSFLETHRYVVRKATTKNDLSDEEKRSVLTAAIGQEELIKEFNPSLVLEMDETLAPWMPQEQWTYAPEGSKIVRIAGLDDHRGNTVTITVSRDGVLLPLQLIWTGLTNRSIPDCHWPEGFLNCAAGPSSNKNQKSTKWQNSTTKAMYLNDLLLPYIDSVRNTLALEDEAKYQRGSQALLIWDHHWSHLKEENVDLLAQHDIIISMIPKKATASLSVLDVAINKPFKQQLKNSFSQYCTDEIVRQLGEGKTPSGVVLETRTTIIKPLAGQWIISAWLYLKRRERQIIESGWLEVRNNLEAEWIRSIDSEEDDPDYSPENGSFEVGQDE
ncbi:hypothetical protein RCL1_007548 [Eukaryota sp. TZLM3-RCL]